MNNLKCFGNLFFKIKHWNSLRANIKAYSLYEPDYLQGMKSQTPLYDALNIQMKGYDYPVLESFQKFVHNMAKNMEINVEDGWAIPAQQLQVVTYKPQSDIVNSQYNLKLYQRVVQVTDLPAPQVTTLLRLLEAACPAGVTIEVVPHEEWHEEARYIPDNELAKLKQELDDMGGPLKKK